MAAPIMVLMFCSLSSCRSTCGGLKVDLCYVRDNLELRHFAHAEIREILNRSLQILMALRAFSPEVGLWLTGIEGGSNRPVRKIVLRDA